MIKSLAYFPSQCAMNSRPVMSAFLDSCSVYGIRTIENALDADAAVIWSVLWNGRMAKNKSVYEHYRAQGKPVIVIDVGALYRGNTWKIAVNNINAQGYYGHTRNLDWDRPKKLGLSLGQVVGPRPDILIAAQHKKSLQVQELSSLESWISSTVSLLRSFTDRPLVLRPHPRCALDMTKLPVDLKIEQPTQIPGTYDNFNIRFDYHAVVNYNSGPGIQSVIEGCPVIVDKSSLAYPMSIVPQEIEDPPGINRQQWFVEICHTEYTVDEIKLGTWLKRIENSLQR